MKDRYNSETLRTLVEYRVQRAKETLAEARYNADGGYFNAAVNRLYYACFYASLALLHSNGIEANSHKGVKIMMGLHFINTGKLEKKYGGIYQQLFNSRNAGDYDDFVYCDSDMYEILEPKAKEFVFHISSLL